MSQTGKSIAKGVSVLSIAGILCKLIGLLFSVPLTRIIGSEGLGIFQSVYPTYNLLLTLSSAGLPVAVSRMVSQSLARENPRGALHVFRTALWILTGLGCVCTILMIVGNGLPQDLTPSRRVWPSYARCPPSAVSCRGSRT